MIEHLGTVVQIDGEKATVQLKPSEQCGATGVRCACCASMGVEPRRVQVDRGELEEGDLVCLSIASRTGYLSAFIVFGLPLILMVGGSVLAAALATNSTSGELPAIVGGLAGFVLGIVAGVVVNRRVADASCIEVRRISPNAP